MTLKLKTLLLTFIISILLNYRGAYIPKTGTTNSMDSGILFSPHVFAIANDYKVCSLNKIYFTHEVRRNNECNGVDIKTIQYYNSSEIVVSRLIANQKNHASTGGMVKYRSTKLSEEIKIPRSTPGICVGHNENILYMSFGKDRNFILPFKKKNGYYQLHNNEGYSTVNNTKFTVEKGKNAILIIQKYETKTRKTMKKTLRGSLIRN